MSDGVEQITKEPSASKVPKEKDPKKVAAGKKLAEYNRRHKEAYEREMKRQAENEKLQEEEESPPSYEEASSSQTWIPELSFSTVISLIGVGIAAIDLYMRYKNSKGEHFDWQPVTTVVSREPASKIPVPTPTPRDNEVVPKIGMS